MPVRVVRTHPRLFVAAVLGVLVIAMLPASMRASTRLLIGWDIGITCYLVAVYMLVARSSIDDIRRKAAEQDEGRFFILALTVGAALASLGAIVAELGSSHRAEPGAGRYLALAVATIALSWAFIHTIFALHYAHEFHSCRDEGRNGGLIFPGQEEPDYWDFVYFSFVVGMTSQVSDVAVADRGIRRTVTAHGAVSFVFNAALLALTVNIAANAI